MNSIRDLEQGLVDYYESEAPRRVPDWVVSQALATIEATPQERRILGVPLPRSLGNRPATLGAAPIAVALFALVAILGALLIWRYAPGPGLPASTPSTSPAASPGRTPFPMNAPDFRVPFQYLLPLDTGLDFGPRTEVLYEIRVPDSGGSGSSAWFLFIQAVEGGRAETCSRTADPAPLKEGAVAVLDYLDAVPDVAITDRIPLEIDGYAAVSATIELEPSSPECEALWVWASDVEPIPEAFRQPGTVGRVTAIEVAGEPILISTWATSRDDEWLPQADALIASLDFQPAAEQKSESPSTR